MPQINIILKSSKSDNEIWAWLEQNLEKTLNKKAGFEKIVIKPDKQNQKIDFFGRTVKGVLFLKNSTIEMNIQIPLLYRFFAPHIKSAVEKIFYQI